MFHKPETALVKTLVPSEAPGPLAPQFLAGWVVSRGEALARGACGWAEQSLVKKLLILEFLFRKISFTL